MTTAAFDQSVTDEINRRMAVFEKEEAKLRQHFGDGEVRDLLQAAEIYDEQAARHAGEAAKCAELARCAREQAANLKLMGDL